MSVTQQQRLSSEITSESAQTLEGQRHSLVQEATAEMMSRDAHDQAEEVSHVMK